MPTPTPLGVLQQIGAFLGKLVAWLPASVRPTQKLVAHTLTTILTTAAVAVLPLELSTQLNAAIVVVAGLVAHWLIPNG